MRLEPPTPHWQGEDFTTLHLLTGATSTRQPWPHLSLQVTLWTPPASSSAFMRPPHPPTHCCTKPATAALFISQPFSLAEGRAVLRSAGCFFVTVGVLYLDPWSLPGDVWEGSGCVLGRPRQADGCPRQQGTRWAFFCCFSPQVFQLLQPSLPLRGAWGTVSKKKESLTSVLPVVFPRITCVIEMSVCINYSLSLWSENIDTIW